MKLRNFWTVDPPLKNDIGIGSWVTPLYFIGESKGGRQGHAPPPVQILSFSCSFWQNFEKIIAILGVRAPPRQGLTVADPGFPRRGEGDAEGGNCMEMKEIGPRGGVPPLGCVNF